MRTRWALLGVVALAQIPSVVSAAVPARVVVLDAVGPRGSGARALTSRLRRDLGASVEAMLEARDVVGALRAGGLSAGTSGDEALAAAGAEAGAQFVLRVVITKVGWKFVATASLIDCQTSAIAMRFESAYYKPAPEAADRGRRIAERAAKKLAVLQVASTPTTPPARPPPAPSPPPIVAPTARAGTVLVLGLTSVGSTPAAAAAITDQIAEALSARAELRVFTKRDLADILGADRTRQLVGCEADTECVARVAEASKARLVLSGSLGPVGRSIVLNLALTDTEEAAVVARGSETIDQIEQAPAALTRLLSRLFRWSSAPRQRRFVLKGGSASFAVLDLQPSGASEAVARNLTQILSTEIKRAEGTSVISRDDIVAMLSADKLAQLIDAECDTSCVAELGGALGVDHLVVGQIGKLEPQYVVSLRLIDPVGVEVTHRITEVFRAPESELVRAVRHAGRRLLGIESDLGGSMAVSGPIQEAEVFIDGAAIGVLPMRPKALDRSGRMQVRVAKDGFFDWESDVFVNPGEATAVWAELEPVPEQWYETWWLWTIVGVAVVGGGVTAGILAQGGGEGGTINVNVR